MDHEFGMAINERELGSFVRMSLYFNGIFILEPIFISVGVVIKALRKKIKSLEEELAKEEELKIHLTSNQEEALQKMAEASASVELRAAEEKKEMEEHFSQLLQKVWVFKFFLLFVDDDLELLTLQDDLELLIIYPPNA